MNHDFGQLSQKDLLSVGSLTAADIHTIYDTARVLKANRGNHGEPLRGKQLAMIFEKDSLRTRFTFEIGMRELGGGATFMDHREPPSGGLHGPEKDVLKRISLVVETADMYTALHSQPK